MTAYTETNLNWRNICLTIRYCEAWSGCDVSHIEVISADMVALPITETGYRSCFLTGTHSLDEWHGDPVRYVLDWLELEAEAQNWINEKQLTLF